MKKKDNDSFLEQYRRPDVYAPDEPLPEPGKKERFFKPGGIIILVFLLSIFGLQVWLKANGYGGIKTVLGRFILGW